MISLMEGLVAHLCMLVHVSVREREREIIKLKLHAQSMKHSCGKEKQINEYCQKQPRFGIIKMILIFFL